MARLRWKGSARLVKAPSPYEPPAPDLIADGVGPVALETTIRFRKELLAGDEVLVSCVFVWGEGKTFRVEQRISTPDGEIVAEMSGAGGLMDLKARTLVAAPGERLRRLADDPAVLGL